MSIIVPECGVVSKKKIIFALYILNIVEDNEESYTIPACVVADV